MAGVEVVELVAKGRKRGRVMGRDSTEGKGATGAQAWGSPAHGPSSPAPLQNVPFIAVTSFLCLRFVSPAIMAPKLFHLRERHADARTSRTLLLLAKVSRAQLGAERGLRPGLHCVPSWLQGVLVCDWATDPLAWHSLQSFSTVAQSHG